MRRVLVFALTALCLSACRRGPAAIVAAPIPDAVVDATSWEREWAREEMDTWREGIVVSFPESGDVRSPEAKPVAGATVELLAPTPDGRSFVPTGAPKVVTGADGRFRVGPGPSDGWIVRVSSPGCTDAWVGGGVALEIPGVVAPPPSPEIRVGRREPHELTGIVVDDKKRPLEGVRMLASSPSYREEVASDAQGRWVAHPPDGMVAVEVTDARYDLVQFVGMVPKTGPAKEVTLVAKAVLPLRGWVVAQNESPIANAVVVCPDDPKLRTRTDAEGRFELPVRRPFRVAAFATGFGWRTYPPPRAGELEMRLSPAARVAGVVVDEDGKPVENARVAGVATDDSTYQRVPGPRTLSDGSFDFSWLPTPPRGVYVPPRCVATMRGRGESEIVPVEDLRKANGKLVLHGARDVSGRATRADGTPLVGATIEARWGHWTGGVDPDQVSALGLVEHAFARTDEQGRWRIDRVPRSLKARIRCDLGGWVEERTFDDAPAGAPLDFVFAKGLSIAGRVQNWDGGPVHGVVLARAQLLNAQGTEVDRTVACAPDGSYRFDDLPPGEYQITANGRDYDAYSGKTVQAGDTAADFRMSQTATLHFHLVFDGGAAPAVKLTYAFEPYGGGALQRKRDIPPGAGDKPVDERGVLPGQWTLSVAGDVWRGKIEKIDVASAEDRTIDVPVHRTLRIAGRLLDAAGAPVPRTMVVFAPIGPTTGAAVAVLSDAEGTLDVTGLSPGKWRAIAEPPGAAPLTMQFDVSGKDDPPLVLRLPASGTLVVSVADEDARKTAEAKLTDATGAPVNAWGAGERLTNKFHVDAEGRLVVRGVRAGPVHVVVESGNAVLFQGDVEVAAGRETPLVVQEVK